MNGDPESQLTLNEAKILINDFKFETENYKIKVVTLDRQIDALKVQLSDLKVEKHKTQVNLDKLGIKYLKEINDLENQIKLLKHQTLEKIREVEYFSNENKSLINHNKELKEKIGKLEANNYKLFDELTYKNGIIAKLKKRYSFFQWMFFPNEQ